MGLDELVDKYSGFFIVDYETYEVIYTEGYENANGIWCYKISDLNKMPEIQNQNQSQLENQQEESVELNEENVDTEENSDQQTE